LVVFLHAKESKSAIEPPNRSVESRRFFVRGVDMFHRLICGKIERFCAHYSGPKFHALLCDPPYELGFMGRDWDKSGIAFKPDT